MPTGHARYEDPETGAVLTVKHLATADSDTQLRVMRAWFYSNFEDPAERTPYESREGGYQWIWGGPFEAREELEAEFEGIVPGELIEELASNLTLECWQWGPAEKPSDYEDYLYEVIAREPESSTRYFGAIAQVNELLYLDLPAGSQSALYKLLFVNVISALEAYLAEAFISSLEVRPEATSLYVSASPALRERKLPLAAIFESREKIEEEIRSSLVDLAWHNLAKVGPLFKATFGVSFPDDLGAIYRAILQRHDIVHRNGHSKDGAVISISRDDVRLLIEAAGSFVRALEVQLPQRSDNGMQFE